MPVYMYHQSGVFAEQETFLHADMQVSAVSVHNPNSST